jgi:hypothetical protein
MWVTGEELVRFGLNPSPEEPGNTGIISADFRHWEVALSGQGVISLVEYIRERLVAGEERLRWIGVEMQKVLWSRFCRLEDGIVLAEAKRRCRWKLEGSAGNYPQRRPKQIEAELRTNPPIIPEHRIKLAAYFNYLDRGSGPSRPDQDWFNAEQRLRDLYMNGFLNFRNP